MASHSSILAWKIPWTEEAGLVSKITADAIKLKDSLLLGRKVMTNLDITLKSRDITLPTKVPLFSYFNRNMEEAGFFSLF